MISRVPFQVDEEGTFLIPSFDFYNLMLNIPQKAYSTILGTFTQK